MMEDQPKLLYFAYGSNMCLERMRSRVSTATPYTIGYVSRRRIVFHKRSHDGSAKADAVLAASGDERVWGVVYELQEHEKPELDRYEFLGIGYDQETVEVVHDQGTVQAWMYVARSTAIDASLLPYAWYHELIVHGARQHGLPECYVDHLNSFESLADPDAKRRAENQRLVRR